MRLADVRAALWLGAVLASVVLSVAAGAQDRVALVIGNSKYVNVDPLPNPANDARTVAQALRDIDFDVTDGFDLTRDGMEQHIRAFLRKAEAARVRLFYYAGHGLQVDDRNYLVPVNTKLVRASDLSFEMIGLDSILDNLDSPSRINIVILDACRSNPFAKTFTAPGGAGRSFAVQRGLAAANPGGGTLIAYSTKPGAVALDGSGANSPFAEALARHLRTPGLEVRQVLTRVRADVIAATRGEQYPWDNSGLLSDVYLAGIGKSSGQIGQPAPPPAPAAEDLVWDTIKDSGSAATFEIFVSKFPASPHAGEARARADELKQKEQTTNVAQLPGSGAIGNLAKAQSDVPYASFGWGSTGWFMNVSIADIKVSGISWRLGDTGEFQDTGFLDAVNPFTGRRMPNPVVELDADQKAATIWVRYVDSNGVQHGPYPVAFDPSVELARGARHTLERTTNVWMEFGKDSDASRLFYTLLVTNRCAIRQVRIGIDSVVPNEILPLPPCDEKAPYSLPHDTIHWRTVSPTTTLVSVELTYRDGSVSKIKTIHRR
jgi:hypothetical protein